MEVNILCKTNSVFNQFIAEIRNVDIQKDSMRFRRNIERCGEVFAYEISKHFSYVEKEVTTPLGVAKVHVPAYQPVIATILRAGLPLHHGLLNYFDKAGNAFVSAYRKYDNKGNFDIKVEYLSSPELDDKILILTDPMLATGQSIALAYEALLQKGKPKHTHIVAIMASEEGIEYTTKRVLQNTTLWIGVVDKKLNAQAYIVPGIGDAGDLAFGRKT